MPAALNSPRDSPRAISDYPSVSLHSKSSHFSRVVIKFGAGRTYVLKPPYVGPDNTLR